MRICNIRAGDDECLIAMHAQAAGARRGRGRENAGFRASRHGRL